MDEPRIAFVVDRHDEPAIEILVNFGVFAGRQATPAEIDDLARYLLDEVPDVSIVAEERHEIDATVEASVHQVRIEVPADLAPADHGERARLAERMLERADHWARRCIAERGLL